MKRIIYQTTQGIAVLIPAVCGLTIEQIAFKDVPQGIPYLIVDTATIPPDRSERDGWDADFTTPDGYGGTI